MKPFCIGTCLRDTWELYCRHLPFLLALYLLAGFPINALMMAYHWSGPGMGLDNVLMLPWVAALLWGVQRRESGQLVGPLRSLGQGLRLAPRLLMLQVLSGVGMLLGVVCFVLPVFYVWVSISVGAALAIGHDRPVDSAFSQSWKLTEGRFWKLLFFWGILLFLVALVTVGNLCLLLAVEYSGICSPAQLEGPGWQLFGAVVEAQLLGYGHLAGLAVLKQLLDGDTAEPDFQPGLNPVAEFE